MVAGEEEAEAEGVIMVAVVGEVVMVVVVVAEEDVPANPARSISKVSRLSYSPSMYRTTGEGSSDESCIAVLAKASSVLVESSADRTDCHNRMKAGTVRRRPSKTNVRIKTRSKPKTRLRIRSQTLPPVLPVQVGARLSGGFIIWKRSARLPCLPKSARSQRYRYTLLHNPQCD